MKTRLGKIISLALFVLVIIIIIGSIKKCERQKAPLKRAENHTKIINRNADNSTIETQYRASKDTTIATLQDTIEAQKHRIRYLEAQDVKIVTEYIKVPTASNGKAVIASKDKVIKNLKDESKSKDGVIQAKDQQLESYGNEVQQHKLTISELDKEFQKMNGQLAKAKKPKRFGAGVYLGYGVTTGNLKPMPSAGISINYNLVRW